MTLDKAICISHLRVLAIALLLFVGMALFSDNAFAITTGSSGDSDKSYSIVDYKRSHFSGYKVENAYLLGDILCTSGMSEMTKEGEAIACDFVFS